ncbi:MAG: hypothetical protein K6F64_06205 [Clostridia bacterium]|nr:hypothetical protein [Clostridia bacterium]
MKKLPAFLAVLLMLLSLASCKPSDSGKDSPAETETSVTEEETPAKQYYTFKDVRYKEEFTDSKGTVRYIIDFTYPSVGGKISEKSAANINEFFENMKNRLARDIRMNIENYADYMDRFDLGPETCLMTYEVYSQTPQLLSVIISKNTAVDKENTEPLREGITFSVGSGERLSVSNLAVESDDETEEAVKEAIIESANSTYSPNGVALSDGKIDIFNRNFDGDNFVSDGNSITFLYDLNVLSEGSRQGTYYCEVNCSDLEGVMTNPAKAVF